MAPVKLVELGPTQYPNGPPEFDPQLDPIREFYYTAAIWTVIQKQTKKIRELPQVHKIKMLVSIGSGHGTQHEDDIMFKNQILLTVVEGRPPATELK